MTGWDYFHVWSNFITTDQPMLFLESLRLPGKLPPQLSGMLGVPQSFAWHPEGWSASRVDEFLLPVDSGLVGSAESVWIDGASMIGILRKLFFGAPATATVSPRFCGTSGAQPSHKNLRSDSFPAADAARTNRPFSPSGPTPAIIAKAPPLVGSFWRYAISSNTHKVVRVVLQIPLTGMLAIMRTTIDDLKVIESIVGSVAVFVMDMLCGGQPSAKMQLHEKSMDSDSIAMAGSTGIRVPVVVMDTRRTSVDGNVLVYFDLAVVSDSDCGHSLSPSDGDTSGTHIRAQMGDAYTHTLHVCDAMNRICRREEIWGDRRTTLMFAALCHDFGKAVTTKFSAGKDGVSRWTSHGHDVEGVPIAHQFLISLNAPEYVTEQVLPLVRWHMTHARRHHGYSDKSIKKLARNLFPATMADLCLLMEADCSGRPPIPPGLPAEVLSQLIPRAKELGVFDGSRT